MLESLSSDEPGRALTCIQRQDELVRATCKYQPSPGIRPALIAYSTQPFTCCTSTSCARTMSRFNAQSNNSLCSPAVISPQNAKAIIKYRRYFSYPAEYAAIRAFEPQAETRARWNSQSYCLQASGCAVSPFKIRFSTWASL